MDVLILLLGLLAMVVGLVSLVKPLAIVRIHSRLTGAVVLGVGLLVTIVGALLVPPDDPTEAAGEEVVQTTTTGEASTTNPSSGDSSGPPRLVPVPGDTLASTDLQAEVLEVLLGLEATSGCNDSVVTDTQVVDLGTGRAEEEWLVDRCGVTVPWTVEFSPAETGGAVFAAHPSAEVSSLELLVDSGVWRGMTSQGEDFLLIVEGRAITMVSLGFEDPTCPEDSPMGIQFGSPKHYLVGNTFAFVDPGLYNLTLTGAFRDDDSALGTLRIEPPSDCGPVIEATWEATPGE